MSPDDATLLVDIGNTRVKWCAASESAHLDSVRAVGHAEAGFPAALRAELASRAWRHVWIASVGPADVLAEVARQCAQCLPGAAVHQARSLTTCGDLRIGYDRPSQLGVDRFLALVAARARWPGERVLLASIGSAVTVDLLERDGAHAGGLIAPSQDSMRRALGGTAAQLAVDAMPSTGVFARDTGTGIANGCALAVTGLVEHCLRAATPHDEATLLVLSGGGAAELAPRLGSPSQVVPFLVLAGLARYARLQLHEKGDDADP